LVKGIYTQTLIFGHFSNNINHPTLEYNILMMNPCKILLKKHTNPKVEREDQNTKNKQHPKMQMYK